MMRARKSAVLVIGLTALVLLPPIAQLAGEPFLIKLSTRVLIYALAAVSLDLILGYGGMVSLGHGAFLGIGAFVVGILSHHAYESTDIPFLPFAWQGTASALIQWPIAIGVSAFFGLIIGALSLRTSGVYFIMITLAFAQMIYFFLVGLPTYGGADGLNIWERSTLPLINLNDATSFYYLSLALLVIFILLLRQILSSRFGMVIRACKQNEHRLRALGVETYRYKLVAFTIASAGAGLAGALIANHTEFVGPGLVHWTRSGEILVMVVLGGMGTLFGPVLGAVVLLFLEEVLTGFTEHWGVILGPILLLVVLFARTGLYGLLAGRGARDG